MMPVALVPRAAHACVTDAECFIFNPCRTNFRCVAGLCYDDPVVCPTQSACTLSHCDLNLGCVYAPACPDDGIVCNGTEYCIVFNNQPSCGRLTLNGCNDGDACTIDYCQEPLGCQHDPLNCNDGDPCTFDSCDPSLGCTYADVLCCQTTADCVDQACRVDRTCVAAFCTAGTPRDCDDDDPFTIDTCDPATGCVHTNTTPTTLPPGGSCDDDGDCPADPDPCRVAACVAGQGCTARERDGVAAVSCVCDRAMPATCPSPLPRPIAKAMSRACTVIERAASSTNAKKQGRLVGRMGKLMGRARRLALGKPGRALPAGCGESLGVMLQDAVSRASTFQPGG
jgi:hypothetical protein